MNLKVLRYPFYRPTLFLLLTMLIAGCGLVKPSSESAQVAAPIVRVVPSDSPPEKRIISSEAVPQNNCGGSAGVSSTIERSRSIIYTLEIGAEVTVDGNGSAGIPEIGEVQVGVEVAAKYGVTYGQEETLSRSLTVSAKEGTNILHSLRQVEYWETGELIITRGDKTLHYPYSFRKDFGVELVKSENVGCPTSTPISQAAQLPTPTTESIPTPTVELSASPTSELTSVPATKPAPIPTSIPGEFKAVGESYEASGISLALVDYTIKSDGTIWLKFAVANQGSSKVLLRYQDKYFSVSDDTGRVYPQDEDFLLDLKQVELSPGDSFTIEGDSYPDYYREIGNFYGKIPEQASHLIVKVSQFADLRDMQWLIPLNAQLSSPQLPTPGTQQPVLEGFSANGITILLSDYNINSDGTIGLKFLIRNEGNNAVLLRYQDKYFEVYDDLGNRYDQDEDFLVEPKQVLLSPGDSFPIEGDSYPDYYREIGNFYGKIPEQASHLIVKVSQFADLRDMQWLIPLN
jgi:hypothetical protein